MRVATNPLGILGRGRRHAATLLALSATMASVVACSTGDGDGKRVDAGASDEDVSVEPSSGGRAAGGARGDAHSDSSAGGVSAAGGAGGQGAVAGSDAASDAGPPLDPAHGTWVLALQQSDKANVIAAFGDTPSLVGISSRFAWAGLVSKMPAALDFWRAVADGIGTGGRRVPKLAIRFMAGHNTPGSVIAQAPVTVMDGPDGGVPTLIPSPCLPDGSPNIYFEDAYLSFLDVFASWATAHDVTIVHLPWYGNLWDELYVGPEVVAACGDTARVKAFQYSATNLVKAHEHLFDRVLAYATSKRITIEFPLSGQGGVDPYTHLLAAYIGTKVAAAGMTQRVFLQSNAWGIGGGIPETTFWACQPAAHAFQELSVKTPDSDWPSLYAAVRAANATYVEVYLPSFFEPNTPALTTEVAKFERDPGPWVACP